jgi:hypothetical protein
LYVSNSLAAFAALTAASFDDAFSACAREDEELDQHVVQARERGLALG